MIISSHFITMDGVIGSPEVWHPEFAAPESIDVLEAQLARVDGLLIGRRTYEEFAAYWPEQGDDVPLATTTNAIRKYVVSSTLDDPPWGPVDVLTDGPVRAAERLNAAGRTVFLTGGRLARTLMEADLVDELQLYLDPLTLGDGMRLFDRGTVQRRFELASCTSLPRGVLHLTYRAVHRTDPA